MTTDVSSPPALVPDTGQAPEAQGTSQTRPTPDIEAAVARLIDQKRDVTDRELLLAGVIELLAAEPLAFDRLLAELRELWPAAGVTAARLETALETGKHGELITTQDASPAVVEVWCLTPRGSREARATASWSTDMYERAARQVRQAALEAFGTDPEDQALRWAKVIRRAVIAGISAGRAVFSGGVDKLDVTSLSPRGIDTRAVITELDRWAPDERVRAFLHACTVAALDPTDPFGTELVTNAVTACLLHAAVARRDVAAAAAAVGPLAGQRLILDTPVLFQLLGAKRNSEPVRRTLRAAVDAGMNVVVAQHTLEELRSALEHVESQDVSAIKGILKSQGLAEELARLVDNDVMTLFASALAEGRVRTWTEFKMVASQHLPAELQNLGVQIREHGNNDRKVVRDCANALEQVLRERGGGRGNANVANDAETMAMCWRRRRRELRDPSRSAWPGAWIASTDRAIGPAMRSLTGDEQWPFTMTVGQTAMLLTRCQDVPSLRELSAAAATLVSFEASEAIACRYPPNVAIELAQALARGESEHGYDVRVAQTLTIEGALEGVDLADPGVVTSRVLGERQRRQDGAHAFHRKNQLASRAQAEAEAERARNDAAKERRHAAQLQKELEAERSRRHQDQAAVARARRARVRDALLALHVVLAVVGAFVYMPLLVGALLAVALFWASSRGWVEGSDPGWSGLAAALVGLTPDLVSLVVWLWPHLK